MRNNEADFVADTIHIYVSPKGNNAWSGFSLLHVGNEDGPLLTIDAAIEKVYALSLGLENSTVGDCTKNFVIWLDDGIYYIEEPIEIGRDIGAALTIKSCNAQKAVVDGGKKIEGWQPCHVSGKAAWCAKLPASFGAQTEILQLFVNGRRAARPRLPKSGFYTVRDPLCKKEDLRWAVHTNTFGFYEKDLQEWKNISDIEVVMLHFWVEERLPIKNIDIKNSVVTFSKYTQAAPCRAHPPHNGGNAMYYVENVFEALTEPGEWYFDKAIGVIYYIPFPDESIETAQIFTAPIVQLIRLVGRPEEGDTIHNITIEGIELRHGGLSYPMKADEAGLPLAGCSQAARNVPGVIYLEGAKNCTIRNCKIWHIGWYGIDVSDGCSGIVVENVEITDAGAGGIKINGENSCEEHARKTHSNTVSNCHIHDVGKIFHSAVGILLLYSACNTISYNHIHDLFYTGISVGWGHSLHERSSYENRIEYNHIHHIGKEYLSDMGGIYTLSCQIGTVLSNNHIHDINCAVYGANAIYLDDGTAHVLVENNLCYRTNTDIINIKGRDNIIRNNVFAFGKKGVVKLCDKRTDNHVFHFMQNIVLSNDCAAYRFNYDIEMSGERFISVANVFYSYGKKEMFAEALLPYDAQNITMPLLALFERDHMDFGSLFEDPLLDSPLVDHFIISQNSPALKTGFKIFSAIGKVATKNEALLRSAEGHIE